MWVNQNFLLTREVEPMDGALDVMFLSLRSGGPLALKMDQAGNVSATGWPRVRWSNDDDDGDDYDVGYEPGGDGDNSDCDGDGDGNGDGDDDDGDDDDGGDGGGDVGGDDDDDDVDDVPYFFPQVTIKTEDMELAGDLIQALASFLAIEVRTSPSLPLFS